MTLSTNDMRTKAITTIAEMPVTEAEMMQAVRTLLLGMGEDPDQEGLIDTPKRVVKSLKYLSSGYQQSLDELLNGAGCKNLVLGQ
jgi:GTP cyclohydrolase IA